MGVSDYYSRLTEIEKKHFPEKLFFEGNEELLHTKRRVSVVGSRAATKEGLLRANIVSKALVRHDIIVVSGLAKGYRHYSPQNRHRDGWQHYNCTRYATEQSISKR